MAERYESRCVLIARCDQRDSAGRKAGSHARWQDLLLSAPQLAAGSFLATMLLAVGAALGFAPASPISRSAVRPSRAAPLMASPLDAVASPLNKWAPAAAAAGGSPLDDLPLEVKALFAIIPIVGVLGLLKSNGMLGSDAPTVGLGETREDLGPEAAVPPACSKALARPCGHPPPQRLARCPKTYLRPRGEPLPRGGPREAAVTLWCQPRATEYTRHWRPPRRRRRKRPT